MYLYGDVGDVNFYDGDGDWIINQACLNNARNHDVCVANLSVAHHFTNVYDVTNENELSL